MYSAVILSGGQGKRMMKDVPKQYLLLGGKPIIMHTLERIDLIDVIDEIIIVCEEKYESNISLMTKQYGIETQIRFANAGGTRQESVYNGLNLVKNEHVIIHEAARPFVTKEDFIRLIENENENVTLGYDIPFTVCLGNDKVKGLLNRDELVNIQLPQKFNTADLKASHLAALQEKRQFTEDSSMVFEYSGKDVTILKGSSINLKISEPVDLYLGEIIYKEYIEGRK